MVTEQYVAGALDGSVDPEQLTTVLAQENQSLLAEIERLQSQLDIAKKHGEVLQQIGTALRLGAGSDLHTACVPEIVALRRDAERYRAFFEAGLPITFLGQDCYDKASLDAVIDQAMTKEQP